MALAKAGFTIGVKPVGALRPHEEVIPSRVEQLAAEMLRDGIQRDPIIIDRESLTVLDGMHRLAVFAKLGIENAVCCGVNYSSKEVSLGRWARVFATGREGAGRELASLVRGRQATLAEAFGALDAKRTAYAVLTPEGAFVSEDGDTLDIAISAIRTLDEMAGRRGWARRFVPEDEVEVPLQTPGTLVLLLRKVTKDETVLAARTGKLFPCKTSMHVIDPRPVAVDYPVDRLNEANDAALREFLKGRQERVVPADSVYEGRRYKERLVFLNQP